MGTATVSHHDVVVIGGRCAGAATARLLAARGHDVCVVERATFPSDVLSTHGLARGGVVQLSRWGLLDSVLAAGTPAVRETTVATPGDETTRQLKHRAGVDLLVAPRRSILDTVLAEAAVAAGAVIRTATTVTGVLRDGAGRVSGVSARPRAGTDLTLTGRHVIAADGLRSAFAGMVGATTVHSFPADVSTYYFYVDQVPWRGFEFHVAAGAYAGVFPTNDGQACVWLCRPTALLEPVRRAGDRRTQALVTALDEVAPTLATRVRAGRVASPVRGCVALPNLVREAYGPGWALVGDAGYHRDPMTGHGITDAFRDAELLAEALHHALAGDVDEGHALEGYRTARDAALEDVFAR